LNAEERLQSCTNRDRGRFAIYRKVNATKIKLSPCTVKSSVHCALKSCPMHKVPGDGSGAAYFRTRRFPLAQSGRRVSMAIPVNPNAPCFVPIRSHRTRHERPVSKALDFSRRWKFAALQRYCRRFWELGGRYIFAFHDVALSYLQNMSRSSITSFDALDLSGFCIVFCQILRTCFGRVLLLASRHQ
jgi:hypothetical protein